MNSPIQELVRSLLYEGYALYPYTPGVKNATPTPFGIVYPPSYAEAQPAAYSMLRLEAVLEGGPDARLDGTVLFLQATGARHEAGERSLELGPVSIAELARGPVRETFAFPLDQGGELRGRLAMRAEPISPTLARVRLCVHNQTELTGDPAHVSRTEALRLSLISTHPLLEVEGGRFISPLEREGERGEAALASEAVNTFPVLIGDEDRAVLGAAIMLPDHPELAPESLGNLFDNTEIEEALLLHVHALTDDEREQISTQDPAVREMIERAESTIGEDIMGLHGRLTYTEPEDGRATNGRPPSPPPGLDEIKGDREVAAAGATVRLGDKIVLRPGTEGDVYDKILDGRTATVERIYRGYDERVYLGVTVDDDPGQDLLRETGRFLFFFADEVEPLSR